MKFKMPKLSMRDKIAIAVLLVFIILVSIPAYTPRQGCEVARPGYKCESAHDVMTEECEYWGEFDCVTSSDVSLIQVEWYIENLCGIASRTEDLDCNNLKMACNKVTGKQVCP